MYPYLPQLTVIITICHYQASYTCIHISNMSLLHKSEPYAHAKYIQIAADFTVDNQTVIILAMPPFTILNHGIHMKHPTEYQYIHRHHLHMLHIFIIHLDCPLKSSSTNQTQVCFTLSSYMSEVRKNNYHKAN